MCSVPGGNNPKYATGYLSHNILTLKISSVVLHPGLNPPFSSALIFSVCSFSLLSIVFNMTSLG